MAIFAQGAETFKKPFLIEAGNKPIVLEDGYAYPTFVDLSGDGVKDLVVGGYKNAGQIHYFEASRMGSYKKGKLLTFADSGDPLNVPGVK